MELKGLLFDVLKVFSDSGFLPAVKITTSKGHAEEIARLAAISKEYEFIVCCGGDGTLNETLNGIYKSGVPTALGYIPAGSTNDFATSIKIPTDILSATKGIVECNAPIKLDLGLFNSKKTFSYIASFGAFTSTSYTASQSAKNIFGHFAYLLEGIKDITSIKPYHIKIDANAETFEGDYVFGAVCNSTSIGGIIKLGDALVNLSDGLFEVILIKQPKNVAELNKILFGIFTEDYSDKGIFEFFKTDKISFVSEEAFPWSLDGEFEQGKKCLEIENLSGAMLLMNKTQK